MSTANFTENRAVLLKAKKDKSILWLQAREEAHYWGTLCHSSAALSKILAGSAETSAYLRDFSARCGKQAAEANKRKAALDKELSLLRANITISDAGMTLHDWREESEESEANDVNH